MAKQGSKSELMKEFNLGQEVKFNIRKKDGVFGEITRPRINRKTEEKYEARTYISPKLWQSMKAEFIRVQFWIEQEDYTQKKLLADNVLIGLCDFMDKVYVSLEVINKEGEKNLQRSVNIPIESWQSMVSQVVDIDRLMPKPSNKRSADTDHQAKPIKLFRYTVDKEDGSSDVGSWKNVPQRKFLKEMITSNKKGNLSISEVSIPKPNAAEVLQYVMAFLIRSEILNNDQCEACDIQDPSQLHHACLLLMEDRLFAEFEPALIKIMENRDEVSQCVGKLVKFLNLASVKNIANLLENIDHEALKSSVGWPTEKQNAINDILSE